MTKHRPAVRRQYQDVGDRQMHLRIARPPSDSGHPPVICFHMSPHSGRIYEAFLEDTPWPDWLDRQWSARDVWASFAWEMKRVSRRLRGKLGEPTAAQRKAYLEAVRRYYAEETFADVEQGIVEWRDGKFRLAGPPLSAPSRIDTRAELGDRHSGSENTS